MRKALLILCDFCILGSDSLMKNDICNMFLAFLIGKLICSVFKRTVASAQFYSYNLQTYTGGRGGGLHFKLTGTVGSTVARAEKKGIILDLGIWLLFLIGFSICLSSPLSLLLDLTRKNVTKKVIQRTAKRLFLLRSHFM